jgi:hypothetical protein
MGSTIHFYIVYLQHKTERSTNKAPNNCFKEKGEKLPKKYSKMNKRLAGNIPASLLREEKR